MVGGSEESYKMSARSADTARERGRAVDALIAASATEVPSAPWSSAHDSGKLKVTNSKAHRCTGDSSLSHHNDRRSCDHRSSTTAADKSRSDAGTTTFDGDDDLVGAVDFLLYSGGGQTPNPEDGLDLCSSTWKSVETMARALAVGQSVLTTISRCYSLPDLGRYSSRPDAAADLQRSAREAGTEMMYSSLVSGRFAAHALAIFRRLGQAPPTQPDSLYLNSSRLPEAVKTLDPGVDDGTIRAWMRANGFENQEKSTESLEALSWTEYRQALSELSPAFRRHAISPETSRERAIATTTPGGTNRLGRGSERHAYIRANHSPRDHSENVVDKTASWTSPLWQRSIVSEGRDRIHPPENGLRGNPPKSPGADSYGVLRRKRHAALSLDYEAITKQLPQVMQPLDPSILIDHIKAQGRRDRKVFGSDGGGLSLWSLDPHERLLKMPLQKEQVSETANPRVVQPRHAAVQLRSRRNEFGRRREGEAGLAARLARNAGVISRQAKMAESKKMERERRSMDHDRIESQRAAETRRSVLVREGAIRRARERRVKMEMLKTCIAHQLRTIQKNEDRITANVRERRNVLRKGEGINRTDSLKRARSSPALGQAQVFQDLRQPLLTPTVPPADQDARWVYSPGNSAKLGSAKQDGSTVTLPNFVCAQSAHADASGRKIAGYAITSPLERAKKRSTVGAATEKKRSEQEGGVCDIGETINEGELPVAGRWRALRVDPCEERQPRSREAGSVEDRTKRRSPGVGARVKTRSRMTQRPSGAGGNSGRDGFPLMLQKPRSPVPAMESRRTTAAFGFGSRRVSKGDPPGARSFLSPGSPSVSPWCRQTALPAEWDAPFPRGVCDDQDRGGLGWADDTSASNEF